MTLVVVLAIVAIFIGVPIAFGLILAAIPGVVVLDLPTYIIPQRMFLQITSPSFLAIPFFVLAGEVMVASGIADRLVRVAKALVGHFRGGVAQASVVMSVGFGGISGSGVADAAAESSIFIPAMKKEGYAPEFAAAVIAAGAALGPIIPPSVVMIIYGAITGVSIAALFLGGLIPGLLIAAAFMGVITWKCRGLGLQSDQRASRQEIGRALLSGAWALMAPVIILAGIVGGVFTATEAGAVAVLYVLFVWGVVYRGMTWRKLLAVLERSATGSAAVVLIIAAASVFAWLLGFTGVPAAVGRFLSGFPSPIFVAAFSVALVLLLGMVMESLSAAIVLIPVLYPISLQVGLDPVYFAVLLALAIVAGGITPPVGLYLYITASVAEVSLKRVSVAIGPFILVFLAVVLVALFWPPLTTWLPSVLLR